MELHPDTVDNHLMGLAFEELIRKFAEISNETAGEHFTPREVIRLMVNLLFIEDGDVLKSGNAVVRIIYDPTVGTGGMLSMAGEYLLQHNPAARLTMFGQELNDESYAVCKADMLIKGQDVGNTADDQLVYINGVIKGKLLENDTLVQQAKSNSKQQFDNSPDLTDALQNAIMDAFDAHTAMSTQALSSARIRAGLKDILLGPGQLYEALRARSGLPQGIAP